jgi:hypothetical protein
MTFPETRTSPISRRAAADARAGDAQPQAGPQ